MMRRRRSLFRRIALWGALGVVAAIAIVLALHRPETVHIGESGVPGDAGVSNDEPADLESVVKAEEPVPELVESALEAGIDAARDESEAHLQIPPHPLHTSLVETIAAESIEECTGNLGNLDDYISASCMATSTMNMDPVGQAEIVVHLMRVRRLLEAGREAPEKVVPALRPLFADAVERWPAARDRMLEKWSKEDGMLFPDDQDDWLQCEGRIRGATYLLAELSDYDSLPILVRAFKQNEFPNGRRGALPPANTFYAIHRLVCSCPEERLSPRALRLRSEYLKVAKCVPEPHELTVTRWSAQYAEDEPRIVIMDPQRRVLRHQPKMKMVIYPFQFTDGELISTSNGVIHERTWALFTRLEAFVRAVYPDARY